MIDVLSQRYSGIPNLGMQAKYKFVTYDFQTKQREYIRPNSQELRRDTIRHPTDHEENQTKVVKYDN